MGIYAIDGREKGKLYSNVEYYNSIWCTSVLRECFHEAGRPHHREGTSMCVLIVVYELFEYQYIFHSQHSNNIIPENSRVKDCA